MSSGGCLIGYSITLGLVVSPANWISEKLTMFIWFLFYFFITTVGLTQILAFDPPLEDLSTSKEGNSLEFKTISNQITNNSDTIELKT
jgi:hypothetical protein